MRTAIGTLAIAVLAAASVSAHVTVWPRESKAGASEKYTVRVPSEGKLATTSVQLEVPDGVTIVAVQAPAGWKHEVTRQGDRITSVTWTMEIKPGEFAEFAFLARNPKEGPQVTWKVHQKYADGTSSDWIGPAGDRQPAPVTKLVAATTP